MNKEFAKMVEISEKLGWSVNAVGDVVSFRKPSPAGQDFNLDVTASNLKEVIEQIKERCEDFDCSEETYLWLDNKGHGKNGAPYDMKNLYEDMEACLMMMTALCDALAE